MRLYWNTSRNLSAWSGKTFPHNSILFGILTEYFKWVCQMALRKGALLWQSRMPWRVQEYLSQGTSARARISSNAFRHQVYTVIGWFWQIGAVTAFQRRIVSTRVKSFTAGRPVSAPKLYSKTFITVLENLECFLIDLRSDYLQVFMGACI